MNSGRLRRRIDRVADAIAWLLGALALLVLLAGVVTFDSVHRDAAERARVEGAQVTLVPATLVEDATVLPAVDRPAPVRTVRATWPTRQGERTGLVPVRTAATAGSVTWIWIDRTGEPVPPPMTPGGARATAVLSAGAVTLGGWAVLAVLWLATALWVGRQTARLWERGWALVEPVWSGRVRG